MRTIRHLLLVWFSLSAAAPAPALIIATYNVENYLVTDRLVAGVYREAYPKPEKEMSALRQVIAGIAPDILAVQEMGGPAYLAEFQGELRQAGQNFPFTALLVPALRSHLERLREQWVQDRQAQVPGVWLPEGLARKYPRAGVSWEWQWIFPARELSRDPAGGVTRRHHVSDTSFQRMVKSAAAQAGLTKRVTPHTFRHSFATHRWKRSRTSAPCKNCSDIRAWRPPRSTPTSCRSPASACAVPWINHPRPLSSLLNYKYPIHP